MELERFSELEQRIRRILEECSTLKDQTHKLEKLLEGKSAELEEAKSMIKVLTEEKDAVRTKVDMLIDMLHDIEVP